MIVTVTANPSVDRTLAVAALERGAVLRATAHQLDPGGKGINVARALHRHGHDVRAVLPSGGPDGARLVDLLRTSGVTPVVVPIGGEVRANVTIVEPDGTTTKVNERGPTLSIAEVGALLDATAAAATGATWVVVSGSLPPGAPDDLVAELVARARASGSRTAVDTSGAPLAAAVLTGPDLVKPNTEELAEVTGRTLRTVGDALEAARELHTGGVATVLASLGSVGALLVDASGARHAHLHVARTRSSVGAGDATLAGYLLAADDGPAAALASAVAFGAAAVALPGSRMPGPEDIRLDLVTTTTDLPLERPLDGTDAGAPALASAPAGHRGSTTGGATGEGATP